MTRYLLADVTALELEPVGNDRYRFYTVTTVMSDGTRRQAPAVNTVRQAQERQRAWFPNATVKVLGQSAECAA